LRPVLVRIGKTIIVELWISKKDFLLRKLKRKLRSGALLEEIHKDIRINHKIPQGIFNFEPSL